MFSDEFLENTFQNNHTKTIDSLILQGMEGLEKYTEIEGLPEEHIDLNYIVSLKVTTMNWKHNGLNI